MGRQRVAIGAAMDALRSGKRDFSSCSNKSENPFMVSAKHGDRVFRSSRLGGWRFFAGGFCCTVHRAFSSWGVDLALVPGQQIADKNTYNLIGNH
jgi:hypothetical protein